MDKTLLKGLDVLEALARSEAARGVSDLARELGLTKSNAHRTLQTLVAGGFVRQDPGSGAYECTLKLAQLAAGVLRRIDVRRVAEPHMAALAASTRETVHLSVLDGTDVYYVHKIDSPQPVRAYAEVAGRAPAHCVATGKALLARQGEDYLRRFGAALERHTPATLATREALRAELARARARGYAVNRGEWRAGVGGVAAAILDAAGTAVAAIGISGPLERLGPARMRACAPAVQAAARAVSAALGHPGP